MTTLFAVPRGAAAVRTAEVPEYELGARKGIVLRAMPFSDESGKRNALVAVGTYAPDAISPRHKHTFEQVRYYIDGDTRIGDEVYETGDCVYFPEGIEYGPQLGVPGSRGLHLTLQYGGPGGIYFPSRTEQYEARVALSQTGTFKDGMYTRADGSVVDGFEALIEHIQGKPCVYPEPRYDRPIRLRSRAFTEVPVPGAPGVGLRRLAFFNESGPEITMLRMQPGARMPATRSRGDRVGFLLSGDLQYGQDALDGISVTYAPDGAEIPACEARTACELLVVGYNIPPADAR